MRITFRKLSETDTESKTAKEKCCAMSKSLLFSSLVRVDEEELEDAIDEVLVQEGVKLLAVGGRRHAVRV